MELYQHVRVVLSILVAFSLTHLLEYDVRTVVFLACSLIAMRTTNARFHAAFAVIGTGYILSVIFRQYFLVL
jgi:uncharacterized protein YybS (DUF2232 family)